MLEDTEREFKPANENPWYLLATLYGEQSASHHSWDSNDDLAARNRIAWNRWMISSLDGINLRQLASKITEATELANYSKAERMSIAQQFRDRAGDPDIKLPLTDLFMEFENLVFDKVADFRGFLFPNIISFSNSRFASSARFDGAIFMQEADFQDVTFCRPVSFYQTEFLGRGVLFQGSEFRSHTSFALADFCEDVPDFRDAKLAEATEWHDSKWPLASDERYSAQQQAYAYQRLKAEMERLKKHEDEQFFFSMELRARRALYDRRSLMWLINYAYDIFGGYGQSIGLPLFWLLACFTIGADILALIPTTGSVALDYGAAEGISLTNIFSILPYKPDRSITDGLSPLAKIVSDVQSVIGILLLFLLGLALRNRFRMK